MGLNRIFDLPRLFRQRRKEEVITLADRARDTQQWELAAEFYQEALDRNPRNPPIWVQYGHALKEWGERREPEKLARAEAAYRKALFLAPGVADTYLQLGHVLKLQGKTDEAQASYLRAFALNSSVPYALQELMELGWSEDQIAELRGLVLPNLQHRTIDLDEWRSEVILANPNLSVALDRPLGIFVHLFYEDLAEEIASCLARIDLPKKIYVSTESDEKRTVILRAFEKFDLVSLTETAIVPNYGYDIAPLLITFIDKLSEHDICLKIHSKKSSNSPPEFGEGWRSYLYDELTGDCERVRSIVATMLVHTNLGLLMAKHYQPVAGSIDMGENFELVKNILARINVDLLPNQKLEFPAGSMFWFRSEALARLADLGFHWHDFGHTVDDRDGTLAHSMERCFLFFCANAGKKWGSLPCQNNTRPHTRGSLARPSFRSLSLSTIVAGSCAKPLDSVLSQSFPDFEVIIVTDATPAETLAIVHTGRTRNSTRDARAGRSRRKRTGGSSRGTGGQNRGTAGRNRCASADARSGPSGRKGGDGDSANHRRGAAATASVTATAVAGLWRGAKEYRSGRAGLVLRSGRG
jgi:tetratricopeptide (TPR) repeat protein